MDDQILEETITKVLDNEEVSNIICNDEKILEETSLFIIDQTISQTINDQPLEKVEELLESNDVNNKNEVNDDQISAPYTNEQEDLEVASPLVFDQIIVPSINIVLEIPSTVDQTNTHTTNDQQIKEKPLEINNKNEITIVGQVLEGEISKAIDQTTTIPNEQTALDAFLANQPLEENKINVIMNTEQILEADQIITPTLDMVLEETPSIIDYNITKATEDQQLEYVIQKDGISNSSIIRTTTVADLTLEEIMTMVEQIAAPKIEQTLEEVPTSSIDDRGVSISINDKNISTENEIKLVDSINQLLEEITVDDQVLEIISLEEQPPAQIKLIDEDQVTIATPTIEQILDHLLDVMPTADGRVSFDNIPEKSTIIDQAISSLFTDSGPILDKILEQVPIEEYISLLLNSNNYDNNSDIKEQITLTLCKIAGKSKTDKELILKLGALKPILKILQNLISNQDIVNLELIEICLSLSYITNGLNQKEIQYVIDSSIICNKLIEHLNNPNSNIQIPSLKTISNIISVSNDTQTQTLLNSKLLLNQLSKLLKSNNIEILKEVCLIISNITACDSTQIQQVIDANLIPNLIQLLSCDNTDIQKHIITLISNATFCATPKQIQYLVNQGSIKSLCDFLTDISLEAIENILKFSNNEISYIKLIEEVDGINKIKQLKNNHCYNL